MPSRTLAAVGLAVLLGGIVVPSGAFAEPARRDAAPDAGAVHPPAVHQSAPRPPAPILLSVEVIPDPPAAPAPPARDATPRDRVDRTANGIADPRALAR